MWINDYLEIQMVQSRLTIFLEAMQAHRIGEELFADSDDIEVVKEEVYVPAVNAKGRDAVRKYYRDIDEIQAKNEFYIGDNLSASQVITVDAEGQTAKGEWYTYKVDVLAGGYCRMEPPYPFILSVGKYENTFIKTDDGWKLLKINWKPVWNLNEYTMNVMPDGRVRDLIEDWPQPFEMYDHVKVEEEDDPEDIRFCESVLNVRNLGGMLAACWNTGDYAGMFSFFENSDDVSFFRQGMPKPIIGMANLETVFKRYEKKTASLDGATGVVLTSTGVVQPQRDGSVDATWTLFSLTPKASDNGVVTFTNQTCRWNVKAVLIGEQWKVRSLEWLDFSTMTDIEGRRA